MILLWILKLNLIKRKVASKLFKYLGKMILSKNLGHKKIIS